MSQEKTLSGKQAVQFIQSRIKVDSPGKYNLPVIGRPNLHEGKYIINFKAMNPKGLAKAQELLREGDYSGAANTNMTHNVFEDANYIPAQGEYVSCMVDWVDSRDGGKTLGIVAINEIATKSGGKTSLGDEFASLLEEEAPASTPELD